MRKKNGNRCGNIAIVSLHSMNPELDDDPQLAEQPRMVVGYVLGGCVVMGFILLVMFVLVMVVSFEASNHYAPNASVGLAGVVIVGVLIILARSDRRSKQRGLFAGALIALLVSALIFGWCVAIM